MEPHKEIASVSTDQQIISTRTFPVTASLLFQAFSKPHQLARWWGPNNFTNTFHEFDLRPGGQWRFTMHGPEGGDYENEAVFTEVLPGKMIAWDRISKPVFRVVITLEPTDGKTTLIFRMIFSSPAEADKLRELSVIKNEEMFDRLEEELKKMRLTMD